MEPTCGFTEFGNQPEQGEYGNEDEKPEDDSERPSPRRHEFQRDVFNVSRGFNHTPVDRGEPAAPHHRGHLGLCLGVVTGDVDLRQETVYVFGPDEGLTKRRRESYIHPMRINRACGHPREELVPASATSHNCLRGASNT